MDNWYQIEYRVVVNNVVGGKEAIFEGEKLFDTSEYDNANPPFVYEAVPAPVDDTNDNFAGEYTVMFIIRVGADDFTQASEYAYEFVDSEENAGASLEEIQAIVQE